MKQNEIKTAQDYVNGLSVEDIRVWLTSESKLAWRLDLENGYLVSLMVDRFAELPGGANKGGMTTKLKYEREAHRAKIKEEEARIEKMANFKNIQLTKWIEAGGKESEFNDNWEQIKMQALVGGTIESTINQDIIARRSKAASTW